MREPRLFLTLIIKAGIDMSNDYYDYLYWVDGILWFNDATVKRVVSTFNKEWNLNIEIENEEMKECRISASYSKENISEALELLEMTLDQAVIEKTDKGYILKGDGC